MWLQRTNPLFLSLWERLNESETLIEQFHAGDMDLETCLHCLALGQIVCFENFIIPYFYPGLYICNDQYFFSTLIKVIC